MSEEVSEAEEIGFEFTLEDHLREERHRSGNYSEFELMLDYHGMSAREYGDTSHNRQRDLWWNYRKFGKRDRK